MSTLTQTLSDVRNKIALYQGKGIHEQDTKKGAD